MKTKQVVHLNKGDEVILTNETSGKEATFRVHSVTTDEEYYLPVRVVFAVPEAFDKKATAVVGFNYRDNVRVV